MDGECANNGAHAEMLKKEGLGDKDSHNPMAKKMCSARYAKAGGKYVLYKAAAKKFMHWTTKQNPSSSLARR
jgi:hypothetical protein